MHNSVRLNAGSRRGEIPLSPEHNQSVHVFGFWKRELVVLTISPQTTLCLYSPLHFSPVKNPPLVATYSLQFLAKSFRMSLASFASSVVVP